MDLHPRAALEYALDTHTDALGIVHGCLDLAIQASCAKWVESYPDLRQVDGNVMAGTVRQCLISQLGCEEFQQSSLRAKKGRNCSVVLSDVMANKTIVRKHPRNYKTGHLIRVTDLPALTLFGVDYSVCSWRPYILWDADLRMQVLGHAWLAAVANIDDPDLTEIYERFDLPPAIMPTAVPPPQGADEDDEEDGWDDEFGGEEGVSDDPA